MPEVGIGVIGYGAMGRAHSYGYTLAHRMRALRATPRLRAISGRHLNGAEVVANRFGFDRVVDDWR